MSQIDKLVAAAIVMAIVLVDAGIAQQPGYLGIRLKRVESQEACLRIEYVLPGSPAERAGIAAGDLIAKVNGVEVDCSQGASTERPLPRMVVGEAMVLSVLRSDKPLEIKATAEAPPAGTPTSQVQFEQREVKMEAGEAIRERLIRSGAPFTIVMAESSEYRYEGLKPEEAELLLWYDYEVMLGPQMHKLFKPGRHELYLKFNPARNAVEFEPIVPAQQQ